MDKFKQNAKALVQMIKLGYPDWTKAQVYEFLLKDLCRNLPKIKSLKEKKK